MISMVGVFFKSFVSCFPWNKPKLFNSEVCSGTYMQNVLQNYLVSTCSQKIVCFQGNLLSPFNQMAAPNMTWKVKYQPHLSVFVSYYHGALLGLKVLVTCLVLTYCSLFYCFYKKHVNIIFANYNACIRRMHISIHM